MRSRLGYRLTLFAACAAASWGCGVERGALVGPPQEPSAVTAALAAIPAQITQGQATTLSWQTSNATSVQITGIGSVSAEGSQTLTPSATTVFELVATGQDGAAEAATTVTVQPPAVKEVIFIGASITQFWASYTDFAANHWTDKGIAGQTSVQVAARFQSDVIALHPDAVHILVGSNDLTAAWVPQTTWNAFSSMIAAAKAAGIAVYIGTVPPWGAGPLADSVDPDYAARNIRVKTLNAWLTAQPGVTVIDYYSMLVGGDGLYNPAMTTDGIHPDAAGYAVMTPAALQALQ
jgi:lysophospholipase L1-like esterase